MTATRREFIGAAAALGVAGTAARAAASGSNMPDEYRPALQAIQAYAQAHQRHHNLPALTLGMILPEGLQAVINVGSADPTRGLPIGDQTLFQIGSISKCMTVVVLHQLAAEGKLRLDGDIRAVFPDGPWPADAPISIQDMIDHVSGLPGDAPAFLPGGLWVGYQPKAHWLYSNTAYALLGVLVERMERKPLGQVLRERLFDPLGMTHSRGVITARDRPLYAIGYSAADESRTLVRGAAILPAPWTEEASGAGCVASTAADMARFIHSLWSADRGDGGLGLDAKAGSAFTHHDVASEDKAMRYGNGLMHRTEDGRDYLHHTGGMVAFSSSFHLDRKDGVGAFASASLGYLANYRPRSLTLFAVQALLAARAGRPIPTPPPLASPIRNGRDFAGLYRGRFDLEVTAGPELQVAAHDERAVLESLDEDIFATGHSRIGEWPVRFIRRGKKVVAIGWGPDILVRQGETYAAPALPAGRDLLPGRFISDSRWSMPIRIVNQAGETWMISPLSAAPLTPLPDGSWRPGRDSWSPERVRFESFVDGKPRILSSSGERYERRDL